MKPSQKVIDFIKDYEKLALNAYLPTPNDKATIGYGMTIYPNGSKVKIGDKITKEKASSDFILLLNKFADEVNALIKRNLTQNEADGLYAIAYNIGIPQFKTSTLLKKVNLDPKDITIPFEFSRWNKQSGVVLSGLTKRRSQEADIYSKNIYNSKH